MIIPWTLLLTVVAAAAPGLWWSRRRARALGLESSQPADVALTVGLAALVAARLTTLALDVALLGALPDPRAAISLGAGLSTPGGVLGGLAAGAWAAPRTDPRVWATGVPPALAGLAAWSALALARGDVGGPVPVSLLEAAAYAGAAVWSARSALPGPRLASAAGAAVAGVHLLGTLVRPLAPTVDADLDILLGLLALGVCLALSAGTRARVVAVATAGAGALALVAGLAAGLSAPAGLPDGGGELRFDSAWSVAELATFVDEADGRPVVVNFWASWCPPCHAEAPVLARTATALADEAAFVGVLIDDDPARGQAFADRYRLPFPTVMDGGLRHTLGMVGLPTTVVLAPDGTVARRIIGGLDARSLTAAVRAAAS